jgi:hypothetical protein
MFLTTLESTAAAARPVELHCDGFKYIATAPLRIGDAPKFLEVDETKIDLTSKPLNIFGIYFSVSNIFPHNPLTSCKHNMQKSGFMQRDRNH